MNGIEIELSELRTDTTEQLERVAYEADGREKVLEAKVEDLSDRLRLGMNKLQVSPRREVERLSFSLIKRKHPSTRG